MNVHKLHLGMQHVTQQPFLLSALLLHAYVYIYLAWFTLILGYASRGIIWLHKNGHPLDGLIVHKNQRIKRPRLCIAYFEELSNQGRKQIGENFLLNYVVGVSS